MKWRRKLKDSAGIMDKLWSPCKDERFFFDNGLYNNII
jgi:hypothetical protein